MPRAKSTPPTPAQSKTTSGGSSGGLPVFVNCDLSDEEREYCKAHVLSFAELGERIENLVTDCYRLSFTYDTNSDCFLCTLTGSAGNTTNSGLALSARAPSIDGALTVLFYKHFERLKEDWKAHASGGKKQQWG